MRPSLLPIAVLTFELIATPARGQSALDRVDPGRVEERASDKLADRRNDEPADIAQATVGDMAEIEIAVGAIDLVGLEKLPRSEFAPILEDYIGRTVNGADLAELVNRLAARARATYPLASAHIEPQALRAGVLRVVMDEGRIERVRLNGSHNSAVEAALAPLVSEEPVTRAELERRLLIAGDIDGVSLGEARIAREDGRNVLVVDVAYRAVRARATLDNDSSAPLGPGEVFGNARFNGVLSDDDTLQFFLLDTVPQVDELVFGRLRYGKRLNASGTEVSLSGSYSRSAPGAYLEPLAIEGRSWAASLALLQPLVRARRASVWFDAALSLRELRQARDDLLVRHDRLNTLSAGLHGYAPAAGGRLQASATVTRGLDLLDATREGDALASRDDADGTFTSVLLAANWSRKIIANLGVKLAIRTQLATQPLLVTEEMGIGGGNSVRGYDYSERSGDQAVAVYGELNYSWDGPRPLNGLEAYGFVDGGKTTNFRGGFGGGSLFSAGGGLRADVDRHTDAGLEFAVPLSGERYDTGDKSPKLRFSITRYF